jgi:hypothetical protein
MTKKEIGYPPNRAHMGRNARSRIRQRRKNPFKGPNTLLNAKIIRPLAL